MFLYLLYKLLFLTFFMCLLIEFKYSKVKSILILSFFAVAILGINYFILKTNGADYLGRIYPISATLPAFISLLLVSRSGFSTVLFAIVTSIFSSMGRFISIVAYMYFDSALISFLTEFAADALIIALFIFVFRDPYLNMLNTVQKGWGFVSLIPTLLMVLIYSLMYYPTPLLQRPANIFPLTIVFILALSFYFIIYKNFKNITELFYLRRNKDIINLQLEMSKREFESIHENIKQAKILHHDLRHYLITVYNYLDENKPELAKDFIKSLQSELDQTPLIEVCNNYYINVILSYYIKKCKQADISFIYDIDLPDHLPVNPVELGLILANGLDNAIQAVNQIDNSLKKEVSIICKKQGNKIAIRIKNPYAKSIHFEDGIPQSSIEGHGYGTKSIAGIVEKNHGLYSFRADNGIFNMTVLFDC